MQRTLFATPDATIIGDDGDNILTGTAGDDIINGLGGNDLLWGGEGNDVLDGGTGDDELVVTPWDGADTLIGGEGIDLVSYQPALWGVHVVLSEGAFGDTFTGTEGLTGSNFNDVLSAGTLAARLYGGMGNDVLVGGPGEDLLSGGDGDDYLYVTAYDGADHIDGGPGHDILSYARANVPLFLDLVTAYGDSVSGIEEVQGTLYDDVIAGTAGDDRIDGNAGNDTIDGWSGNDTLIGGSGDDTLLVGNGNSAIVGGDGSDTASFANVFIDWISISDGVEVNLALGTATVKDYWQFTWIADTLSGIENVVGSGMSDILNGDAGANSLSGGDWRDQLWGGEGNDILDGGDGWDRLLVTPWDGADMLIGGDSDHIDTVSYELSEWGVYVVLSEGAYGDTLIGIEAFEGSGFDDVLSCGTVAAHLDGGMGNDVLVGGPGADSLYGGDGDDCFYVTPYDGADYIDGGPGYDVLSYDGANTGLTLHIDWWTGLLGDKGRDVEEVQGSPYDDVIAGSSAEDRIDGNDGNDTLTGNYGADTFMFTVLANALTNLDTITDFGRVASAPTAYSDKLEFSKAVFVGLGSTTGPLAAEQFWSGAGVTTAHDADDRMIYDTTTGALYYDADGVGGVNAVQVALLGTTTHPELAYTDIMIGG